MKNQNVVKQNNSGKNLKSLKIWLGATFFMIIPIGTVCLGMYRLFKGSSFEKLILILLLIYQYTLADQQHWLKRLFNFLKWYDFFQDHSIKFEEGVLPLKKNKQFFLFFPHGVLPHAVSAYVMKQKEFVEIDVKAAGTRWLKDLPFCGLFYRLLGYQTSDNANMLRMMRQSENIAFVPGGFEEASLTTFGKDKVYLANRKGFIKYALRFGYMLYPVYTFNQTKQFYTLPLPAKVTTFLNRFRIPAVIFYSRYLGLFPNDQYGQYTVVGRGIQLPLIQEPSQNDIDKYHQIFIDNLKSLFNKYKDYYENSEHVLEIYPKI